MVLITSEVNALQLCHFYEKFNLFCTRFFFINILCLDVNSLCFDINCLQLNVNCLCFHVIFLHL